LEKAAGGAWISSVLPFSIAQGPVGTLVQLYILNAHGTVIDVGLAIALCNAIAIPAAIVWGFIADHFQRKRLMIMASYSVTAGILISLFFARTVYSVSFLYALFSFATSASTTPLNLLIMGTEHKQKWATAFARFSMVTNIGHTAGVFLSLAWSFFLPLDYLVVPLATLSMISAGLSVLMIKETSFSAHEQNVIVMSQPNFFERLLTVSYLFLRIPRLTDFRRVFRALRHNLTMRIPLLYFSIFAFYFASGILNTSVVPSLQANHISSLLIFFVTTIWNVVQIISFKYAGPCAEKKSSEKAAIWALVLRSVVYVLMGVSVYILSGIWYFAAVLILYPVAAGSYSLYCTASNTMVFNTLGSRGQGSSLGVYTALLGIAMMVGSLISGFMSFYLGFYTTFITAAVCLICSAWLVSMLMHSRSNAARISKLEREERTGGAGARNP
jgi:MFS family permease